LDISHTHHEIVEACKKGDRHAQFELYRLYSKAMYNVCLRMVRNDMDAEDLLQNSFVDIYTKLHTFKYQSSVGAWIKRVTINNCINHLKKKRLQFEELTANNASTPIQEEPIRKETMSIDTIKKAVYQLPDGYRVVFSLYAMEGYNHKEIAQILQVTEATSKSQYSRAKKKLQELLSAGRLSQVE